MKYSVVINEQGTVAVDDTLLVKGVQSAAGSKIMEGFKPLFSAEAVERLLANGYTLSGKTNVGEFGLDLAGEFSYYAPAKDTIVGAAASLVADSSVEAALAVDMNGAPRRAAALSDVVFVKPTYGTVSRYGVISCAASGETVGVYAKDVDTAATVLGAIAGHDDKDGTSLPQKSYSYDVNAEVKGKKVAVVNALLALCDDETKARFHSFVERLQKAGVEVVETHYNLFSDANLAWQILMCAETCNNVSRYDGVKFGHRAEHYRNIDELYTNSRTEGFNFLTKSVILYGSDVLSKNRYAECYDKSLRLRRVISDTFKDRCKDYSAVIAPACSKAHFNTYDIADAFETVYRESEFTALANLIGTPVVVCDGVQLMGDAFSESLLFSLANAQGKEK